jgi:hypothetical protein
MWSVFNSSTMKIRIAVSRDRGQTFSKAVTITFSELCKPSCKVGMSHQVTVAARVLKARRG